MNQITIGIIGLVSLVGIILIGFPVAFAMLIVGFIGFCVMISISAGLNLVAQDIFSTFSSYSLTVVPMFVLMGSIAFSTGTSGRLFKVANNFFGHFRGGLSMATIGTCAAFAAICGSANAAVAAMGKVSMPEMEKYHYSPLLAAGCVASGGTLGVLIPPSTIFIIYGILTSESIGKLFIAGIIPGIILTAIFCVVIFIMCTIKPALGPAGLKVTWHQRLKSLGGISEMLIIFLLVMGGIFTGIFTPTEAGAVGASMTIIIGLIGKNLKYDGLKIAVTDTVKITCMLFFIIAGATVFGHFIAVTQIPAALVNGLSGLDVHPLVIAGIIFAIYLVGGLFIDILPLILLTVPIFAPVISSLNFSLIWFGVVIVLIAQIGAITPPVGVCAYVIKGVCPHVPLSTIFRGCIPFVIGMIFFFMLLLVFPSITTFLPSLM